MTNITTQSKSGAASMFVVIFTTLLLGVITLSFIRIMLSEANQTTNYDLSQSAYDSALAGIEDAKVALLKYHECLSAGRDSHVEVSSRTCESTIAVMAEPGADQNCNIISDILHRATAPEGETIIQSEDQGTQNEGDSGAVMNQAYTCVTITEVTENYISTLTPTTRSKNVPIRTGDENDQITHIRVEWFNAIDASKIVNMTGYANFTDDVAATNDSRRPITTNRLDYSSENAENFKNSQKFSASKLIPPALQVQLFQTSDQSFTLNDLNYNQGSRTNRGSLLLRPSLGSVNEIANSISSGFAASADKALNNPIDINCQDISTIEGADDNYTSVFACSALIQLPEPIGGGARSEGNTFLRLSIPYGDPSTTFSIKLLNGAELQHFVGVQARIDSTGRANDLLRRVEARIELEDVLYPYPDYVANLSGNDDTIWKNFYITQNCWTTSGGNCPNFGTVQGP